ncbi:DUF1491 family protein [Sandaracinobacteroides hominis]|uniref:DUF1491 family protein n=1 Tax=Sandaracinobacteroides hominis TaxID=2780086 RepID=UPI0018F4D1FB|nr:DUF1491 family protein [Sandaracinobacteroides hominis]
MDLPEHVLPASTQVAALSRQVQSAGGFATVLHKGNNWGSALLLVHRSGPNLKAYEKVPSFDGQAQWRLAAEGDSAVEKFVAAQQRFDTDLWVLELDIADVARFVPGLSAQA